MVLMTFAGRVPWGSMGRHCDARDAAASRISRRLERRMDQGLVWLT